MPNVVVSEKGVVKLLKNLNSHKAERPDEISSWVLNTTAEEIAPAQLSLDTGGYTPRLVVHKYHTYFQKRR